MLKLSQGNDRFLSQMLLYLNIILVFVSTVSIYRVESTILAPKARICFNSMSSSFQSECVYCDSRLYASTITACTGQPMLANNITQNQAFCIATACLQVPVLKNTEPYKVANDLYEHSTNKLNLFRPASLFAYKGIVNHKSNKPYYYNNNNNNKQNSLTLAHHRSRASFYPKIKFKRSVQEKWNTLLKREKNQSRSLIQRENHAQNIMSFMQLDNQQQKHNLNTTSTRIESSLQSSSAGSIASALTLPPVSSDKDATAANANITTVASPDTTPTTMPDPTATEQSPIVVMATEETNSVEYPNFNQVYSQIYNSMADQKRPLVWRPSEYKDNFYHHNSDKTMNQKQLPHLKLAANRVANLMHTVSNNLAIKKASLLNDWYQNRNNFNYAGIYQPTTIGSRNDLLNTNRPIHRLFNSNGWPLFKFNYINKRYNYHDYPQSYVHTPVSTMMINNNNEQGVYSLQVDDYDIQTKKAKNFIS